MTISGLLISGGYGSVEVQDWFNNQQHCKVVDLPEERFSHTQVISLKVEELIDNEYFLIHRIKTLCVVVARIMRLKHLAWSLLQDPGNSVII